MTNASVISEKAIFTISEIVAVCLILIGNMGAMYEI